MDLLAVGVQFQAEEGEGGAGSFKFVYGNWNAKPVAGVEEDADVMPTLG